MEPDYLDDLKALLCDPEGIVCIHGSEMDRHIIQRSLAGIEKRITDLVNEIARLNIGWHEANKRVLCKCLGDEDEGRKRNER